MGLNIQRLAALGARVGMSIAGNAKVQVTLRLGFQAVAYNPASDTTTPTGGVELAAQALRYQDEKQLAPNRIVQEGQNPAYSHTYGIEGAAVSGQTITPGDTVVDAGETWTVTKASIDPGGGIWIVNVRR